MKAIIFLTFSFILFSGNFKMIFGDSNSPELYFQNYSNSRTVTFKVYPISCIFNFQKKYDLKAIHPEQTIYNYNNGRNISSLEFTYNSTTGGSGFAHDAHPPSSANLASLGYGKYKVVVSWTGTPSGLDTCTIEYDYGYHINPSGSNFAADCTIGFRDDNSDPRIVFEWGVNAVERNTRDVGKKIEAWESI